MWYRIELNKDRSVKSCVEVECSINEGRTIHYVEAESREQAIEKLAAGWAQRTEKVRRWQDERKQKGLCKLCKDVALTGKRMCRKHLNQCKESQKRYLERKKLGLSSGPRKLHTNEEKALSELRQLASRNAAQKRYLSKHPPGFAYARVKRNLFRDALEAFESMSPSRYRGWLVAKLHEQQDIIDGKQAPIAAE